MKERRSKRWDVWVTFEKSLTFRFDKPIGESDLKEAIEEAFRSKGVTVTCGAGDNIGFTSPMAVDKNGKELPERRSDVLRQERERRNSELREKRLAFENDEDRRMMAFASGMGGKGE